MNVLDQVKSASKLAKAQHHKDMLIAEEAKSKANKAIEKKAFAAVKKTFPSICNSLVKAASARKYSYNIYIYENSDTEESSIYDIAYETKMIDMLKKESFHIKVKTTRERPTGSDDLYGCTVYSRWLEVTWN